MANTYPHISSGRRRFNKALILPVMLLLSGWPGSLLALFTSTVHGFFPKDWEGRQAMVVTSPLHGPPVIDTTTVVNRSATFSLHLDEPCPAYVWVDGNTDDIHFFIDAPTINIGIDPIAFILVHISPLAGDDSMS